MKKSLLVVLALVAGAVSARADLVSPRVLQGAVLGGAAGAIIGNQNNHRTGQGAAIGALAGALIGSAVDQRQYRTTTRTVVYSTPPLCDDVQTVVYEEDACPPPPRVVYVVPRPRRVVVYSQPRYEERRCEVVYVDQWGRPLRSSASHVYDNGGYGQFGSRRW
jgi:hypothetical protein